MKTIIFVGSPHRKGETMSLVNEFVKHVHGEVEIINVFDQVNVKPCIDCGYCIRKPGCSIKDDFPAILERIQLADAFVIASPMWFGTVSGPMLAFFSRLQTISCGIIFRKDIVHKWDKAGVFMMTTGAKWHSMGKSVETTIEFIFSHLDAGIVDFIYSTKTDVLPANKNLQSLTRCRLAAERLNQWYTDKESGKFYKYLYNSVNYLPIEENTFVSNEEGV